MKPLVSLVTALILSTTAFAAESWTQWGGEGRDFTVKARKLSQDWGESGPPKLWERKLGGGFSSIISDGKTLYTHYRNESKEIVVALDPNSGETKWEVAYPAPIPKVQWLSTQYGEGPNATPLLMDGKIITLGFMGHLTCVDTKTGTMEWQHFLGESHDVKMLYFGHSASPLAVGKNVVVVAGGLLAFDLKTGDLAWENREHEGSYGSPILHKNGQIVTPIDSHLAGFDPKNGKLLWAVEHKNQWGTLLNSPVVDDEGRIALSAGQVGTLLVDPTKEEKTAWVTKATQVAHSNIVRDGEWLYASTGDANAFLTATSIKDGSQAWKKRGFARSNLIKVGDQYILLDFDAKLALLELSGKEMKILTQTTVGEEKTWTPPTLLDTTLYLRDEDRIWALDLSAK